MSTLYLECNSGISGDMTVAALLDLGADEQALRDGLASLNIGGYEIKTGRVNKCGISAYDFDVVLYENNDGHTHEHDHKHEHSHPHEHDNDKHGHEHGHNHDGSHTHGHSKLYACGHGELHGVGHAHEHEHRGIREINAIIDSGKITDNAKRIARKIFAVVANAEAKVHGVPVNEVHFHEVGAVDSIVDIVGAAICFDNLGVTRVKCTPLREGQGTVWCRHGRMPVPAPATLEIISAHKIPLIITDNQGEMVTPTGAAIVAAMANDYNKPGGMVVKKTGYGAGKKDFVIVNFSDGKIDNAKPDFGHANILRASIIEELAPHDRENDEVMELACNIDDMTGETLAYACELLMESGALDCWLTPIIMKKGRPAQTLSLLVTPARADEFTRLLFLHTTTAGVRKTPHTRAKMCREAKKVPIAFGELDVKEISTDGVCKTSVEYESAKRLAKEYNVPIAEVYRAGELAIRNKI